MSAQYNNLIEVKYVTDHDCGNYQIGEVDFGLRITELEKFLKDYGYQGKKDLITTLGHMIYQVENTFQSLPDGSQCSVGI